MTTRVRATVSANVLCDVSTAQRVLDRHVIADAGGRCAACGEMEPCRHRVLAQIALLSHGRLPRRRPMATVTPSTLATTPIWHADR